MPAPATATQWAGHGLRQHAMTGRGPESGPQRQYGAKHSRDRTSALRRQFQCSDDRRQLPSGEERPMATGRAPFSDTTSLHERDSAAMVKDVHPRPRRHDQVPGSGLDGRPTTPADHADDAAGRTDRMACSSTAWTPTAQRAPARPRSTKAEAGLRGSATYTGGATGVYVDGLDGRSGLFTARAMLTADFDKASTTAWTMRSTA